MNNYTKAISGACGVLGILLSTSYATSFSASATVDVVEAIVITETTALNFGDIAQPASGTETLTIGTDGTISGTADPLASTGAAAGVFTIGGLNSQAVDVLVTASNSAVNGVTLTEVTAEWNSDGESASDVTAEINDKSLGTADDDTVTVGGTISATNSASDATIGLTVAVDYD